MDNLKIILVDDNDSFRKALKNLLLKEYDVQILFEATNGYEFNSFKYLNSADLIFMDIMMPGIDGISLAKETLWKNCMLKIIAITMHVDKVYLETLIKAGFKGCLFKSNIFDELDNAMKSVMNGKFYFPKGISLY